ncbi:hypothetical protein [Bradyrhizobium sp.]
MATAPVQEQAPASGFRARMTDLFFARSIRFKPDPPPFDPRPRPPGWAGHWSEAYGRVLAYTFPEDPPFSRPAHEVISSAPRPLQEAIEPLAGSAELVDRNGRTLPWQWSRSLTADLLGPIGVALAVLSLATVLAGAAISLLKLPPLMDDAAAPPAAKTSRPETGQTADPSLPEQRPTEQSKTPADNVPAQSNEPGKSDALGSQTPVQTAPPRSPAGRTADPSLLDPRPTEPSKTPIDKAPEQLNERRKSDAPGGLLAAPPAPPAPPPPPSRPIGKPRG